MRRCVPCDTAGLWALRIGSEITSWPPLPILIAGKMAGGQPELRLDGDPFATLVPPAAALTIDSYYQRRRADRGLACARWACARRWLCNRR